MALDESKPQFSAPKPPGPKEQMQMLRAYVREWRDTCEAYEEQHRIDGCKEAADYHRGGKEAFQRVLDEIGPGDGSPNGCFNCGIVHHPEDVC